MCGIAGLIYKNPNDGIKENIKKMTDVISHRGPDGEGFYFDDNLAFGHRRLSIIDLSDFGHQPMMYLSRYVITYNGEIYNYIELREELKILGYNFKSDCDTEVILASYDAWGYDCLNKFNGMWAFAIYDIENNNVFCSRDRFGVKPFYYQLGENNLFQFGSELKQINIDSTKVANKSMLLDFLVVGLSEHTEHTFFEGIFSLKPGSYLVFDIAKFQLHSKRFYNINEARNDNVSLEEAVFKYKSQLKESIMLRLRSDVTVGSCLSGGLDSSSVSALATQILPEDIKFNTITAVSEQKSNDESYYADLVSDHVGAKAHHVKPRTEDFLANVDEIVYYQDEPIGGPSLIMQSEVFKYASRIGCKVMLDGQGGDEHLLGYERYFPSYIFSKDNETIYKKFISSSACSKLTFLSLLKYCVYFYLAPARIATLIFRNRYLKFRHFREIGWRHLFSLSKSYRDIKKLQKLEIEQTQLPHLLRYEDRSSMAHSVEARLPFLDYRLIEMSIAQKNEYKIRDGWTKFLLRKAIDKDLPKEITWRKNKFGFEAPDEIWFRVHQDEIRKEILESEILKQLCRGTISMDSLSSKIIWRMYFIAKWEKIHKVRLCNEI